MSSRPFQYKDIAFRPADTAEERACLLALCADVYRAELGGAPVGDPIFDVESTIFGAWLEGRPVGTVRCVLDGPRGLPLESASGTRCDVWRTKGSICEMGRFAIPRQSALAPFALMGLVRLSLWHIVESNVTFLLSCAPERIWPLYRRMQMVTFGDSFLHPTGERFVLGATDLPRVLAGALADLELGRVSSFFHEILAERNDDEERLVRDYLARAGR